MPRIGYCQTSPAFKPDPKSNCLTIPQIECLYRLPPHGVPCARPPADHERPRPHAHAAPGPPLKLKFNKMLISSCFYFKRPVGIYVAYVMVQELQKTVFIHLFIIHYSFIRISICLSIYLYVNSLSYLSNGCLILFTYHLFIFMSTDLLNQRAWLAGAGDAGRCGLLSRVFLIPDCKGAQGRAGRGADDEHDRIQV